jgi:hypothetical protein
MLAARYWILDGGWLDSCGVFRVACFVILQRSREAGLGYGVGFRLRWGALAR